MAMMREQETCIPGGEMVLSKTEGIVISITGLLDEMPPAASLYARSISSMLEEGRISIKCGITQSR